MSLPTTFTARPSLRYFAGAPASLPTKLSAPISKVKVS